VARERTVKQREGNEIEFSRIVAFSDGVFAIAITLLVLQLEIPPHLKGESFGSALWGLRRDLLAYAISFAVIGRFWVVHHRLFADVVGFDSRLLGLNIFYLAWIVLIPFSSTVLGDHGSEAGGVVVYAVNLAAVALVGSTMGFYAHRAGLSQIAPEEERRFRIRGLFIGLVFLISIPLALVAPDIAPYLWLVLFLDPSERLVSRGEP
jgi:TMEM175 potassium channel family protein